MSSTPAESRGNRGPGNVAKLLARLIARSPALSSSAGGGHGTGMPDMDAPTIAGAIGWARRSCPLGVEILCLRWWPGYASTTTGQQQGKDMAVRTRRRMTETVVRLRSGLEVRNTTATSIPERRRASTGATRQAVHNAEAIHRILVRLVAKRWYYPNGEDGKSAPALGFLPPSYMNLLRARHGGTDDGIILHLVRCVLDEFVAPSACRTCRGDGVKLDTRKVEGKPVESKHTTCPECLGHGTVDHGINRRARSLGIRAAVYQHDLDHVYRWLLGVLRTLEQQGTRAVLKALKEQID